MVAAPLDLLGTKLKVMLQRAELRLQPEQAVLAVNTVLDQPQAQINRDRSVLLPSIEQRIAAMAAHIQRVIPGCEVRLFGSRARGAPGLNPTSIVLITLPDDCMERHHRPMISTGCCVCWLVGGTSAPQAARESINRGHMSDRHPPPPDTGSDSQSRRNFSMS
jgi:hypothetical protein